MSFFYKWVKTPSILFYNNPTSKNNIINIYGLETIHHGIHLPKYLFLMTSFQRCAENILSNVLIFDTLL